MPETLTGLDFASWEQNIAATVDRLDKLIDGIDDNPITRFVLQSAGILTDVDTARKLLDTLDAALHTNPT
jgi:hypothetical protein